MFDIITLGSGTEDVFIKTRNPDILKKNSFHEVCYPIGTKIIVDDLYFSTGGGGTNTAVAFSRLGLRTAYLGKLGNDRTAREITRELEQEKVKFIGKCRDGKTGYSVVLIGLEKDRTILTYKGMADKLMGKNADLSKLNAKWLYFSSMMGQSFETLKKVARFAKKKKIRYAYNPSSYCTSMGRKYLMEVIEDCDLLVMNREEAGMLVGRGTMNSMLKKLQQYGKIAVITDGKNGACAYNGISKYTVVPRNVKVVETTGAGDAFASGMTAGIIKNKSLDNALRLGQFNAESVIASIGAKNNLLRSNGAEKMLRTAHIRIKKEAI